MMSKHRSETKSKGYSSIHTDAAIAAPQDELDKPPGVGLLNREGHPQENVVAAAQSYVSPVESGNNPRPFVQNGAGVNVNSVPVNRDTPKVFASSQQYMVEHVRTYFKDVLLTFSSTSNPNVTHHVFIRTLENAIGQVFLIEGVAGSGKTSLIKDLVRQCQDGRALQKYTLVIVLSVSEIFEAESIDEFKKAAGLHHEALDRQSTGNQWLIITELSAGSGFADNLPTNSIVKAILQRKLFPEATLLVTGRPSQVSSLKSIFKVHTHYRLTCTVHGMVQYLKEHSAHGVLSYIQRNHLEHMCANPLILSILVHKARIFETANTQADFVRTLVSELIYNELDSDEISALGPSGLLLERLPETVEAVFDVQCRLSMEHALKGHACKDLAESNRFLSAFCLTLPKVSLEESFRLGLVEMTTDDKANYGYQFLDPVIMQFLVAFHLYKQAPLNQLHFLFERTHTLFDNGFNLWLRFFLGLVGGDYTSHITMHNPSKLMLNSVIDVLVYNLMADHDPEYRLEIIKAIHQTQEKSLFKKLASKHPAVLDLSMKVSEFEDCVEALVSLIIANKSSYSTWLVSTAQCNNHLIERLQEKVQNIKLELSYHRELVDRIDLSPKRNSADRDKVLRDADRSLKSERTEREVREKLNQFCCRAVREILQRVFPMYSEVKLKGDSTNVSYVSFLTCGCFKKSFLQHVQLFPLIAVHFLDGERKVSPSTPSESLTATDRHNLAEHDGNSLEVVIMLRPLVQRLEGAVPFTNEPFSLVFSKDLELVHSSSAPSSGDAIVRCIDCKESYEVNGDHTEQIVPPLPVVQKTLTARSQTAYPKAFIPPASGPPREDPVLPTVHEEREESHDDARISPIQEVVTAFPDQQAHSSNQFLQLHRPLTQTAQTGGASSVQPVHGGLLPQTAFEEQAVGERHSSSRRQGPLTPGTVLFTSMPEKIPADRIMPLPTQRTLIRKGGNGSIYSENVAGVTMAVKRTSYRSKEYAIITKIRHKNLIPLFAYTWGEEHERSRRRFYVYHYLPKLSGDLARLLTDHEDLSLAQFHIVNRYSPRVMGVAVGNIKYVLSQILEGMSYLHELRIAHRDLKASNILIKFFCNCDTPLTCGCEVKYQVVICDFDAAIELDSQGRIPPTQSPTSPSRGYTPPHFEVVPVGTNGFRSPESSMLTISNDPAAFSPPLSTKTDMYSFGVLALRLMISTDMAYSQRSMAMLLLHYHHMKGVSEGRIAVHPTCARYLGKVDTKTAEKIVKLHKLRPKMSWLRGAYEFVSQCLSVDPQARPSAGDLLRDPFLY